jgi:acyl-CoA reductase-like NAD-dependent aldehyde dehydrogenase
MIPGDALDPKTKIGPAVSREQFDRVKGYLEAGKQEGARVTIGGGPGEERAITSSRRSLLTSQTT